MIYSTIEIFKASEQLNVATMVWEKKLSNDTGVMSYDQLTLLSEIPL